MVIHQTEASPLLLPCFVLPLGTIALRFGKGRAEVTQVAVVVVQEGKNNVKELQSVAATEAFLCS